MSVLITIFLGILIVRLIVKDSNFTSKPNFIFKMLDTLAESKDKIYFSINKECVVKEVYGELVITIDAINYFIKEKNGKTLAEGDIVKISKDNLKREKISESTPIIVEKLKKKNYIFRQKLKITSKKIIEKLSLIFITLMVVGILILGIYFQFKADDFFKTAIKTTAIITDIKSDYTGSDTSYYVYIDYTVDGTLYHSKYEEYYTGMSIGQEVEIYYNPDNPYENKCKTSKYNGYIMILFITLWVLVIFYIQKRAKANDDNNDDNDNNDDDYDDSL